jgi:hypothetical protein
LIKDQGDAMVGKQLQHDLLGRSGNGCRPPASPSVVGAGPELPTHLEKFATWWHAVRLLRGPYFWAAIAVVVALLTVVVVLSWQGWRPGPLGTVLMALGMVILWRALMTAFAGWILRRSN